MGGVIRCYRTTPRQLAIGGSQTTHRLQITRPVARGGTNSGLCRPSPHGMRPHMQHGMKCAARGHERDATWKLGCLRVKYIPKAYTCNANTHLSRDAGPGRGPSGARFHGSRGVPSRDGMAELEAGMMHEHGACGHLEVRTPVHACACAVHAQHLST